MASIITSLQVLVDFVILVFLSMYYSVEAIFRIFVPPALKSITGEVVLITGAAKGIGRETCLKLAKLGAKLVCWDVDAEGNKLLAKELKDLGCEIYTYQVDVSNRSQVEEAALKVKRDVGDVTILFNNAGIMPCKRFLDQNPIELERLFQINVLAHFWTLKAFLPQMISQDRGHIVTICSAAGLVPTRNLAGYCGSKFAVHGFIESFKDELKHYEKVPNIKFTTVYPFSCNTGLLTGVKSFSRFPLLINPVLEPEDVAEAIVDGFRRSYEHIYIPGMMINFAGNIARALLPKIQYAAKEFMGCHVEPVAN